MKKQRILSIILCLILCTTLFAASLAEEKALPIGLMPYEAPVTVIAARNISSNVDETSYENNEFIKRYKEDLNIDLQYEWLIMDDQYDARVSMMFVTQELPDIFPVNATQLKKLVDADLICDLTDAWKDYATDKTLSLYAASGETALAAATYDGKLYGIPEVSPIEETTRAVFIRSDWLEKLGLSAPTTKDEMLAIMDAFATQDPDGNGQNDTYAFAFSGTLYPSTYDIVAFANMFGAFPDTWIEKDGKIVYGGVQPEMKEALTVLAQMYKEGKIDPEFYEKDNGGASQLVLHEQAGIAFGKQWTAWTGNAFVDLYLSNPDSQWISCAIPGAETVTAYNNTNRYFVVRKGFEHPEAIVKMLNMIHYYGTEYGSTVEDFNLDDYLYYANDFWPDWELALIRPETVHNNMQKWINTFTAIKTDADEDIRKVYASYLNLANYADSKAFFEKGEEWRRLPLGTHVIYPNAVKGPETDYSAPEFARDYFGHTTCGQAFKILKYYIDNDMLNIDKKSPITTDTYRDNWGTLDTLAKTYFTRIITGELDIDAFDTFVNEWNEYGGEQITNEMNE